MIKRVNQILTLGVLLLFGTILIAAYLESRRGGSLDNLPADQIADLVAKVTQ